MDAIIQTMDERIQDILMGIKLGDRVRALWGSTDKLIAYTGFIRKCTQYALFLEVEDGELQRVPLDALFRNVERIKADNSDRKHIPPPDPIEIKPVVVFRNLRQMAPLHPAVPYHFDAQTWIDRIRMMVKKSDNVPLKQNIHAILDSLISSIKDRSMGYKYHNLRAKLHMQWEICNSDIDYEIFYLLMGVLAVCAEDYAYALEPLVRAGRYTLAAYSASMDQNSGDAGIFSVCALLAEETGAVFDQFISEICIDRHDSDVLELLLRQNQNNIDICESIASCAYYMYQQSNGKLSSDITPYFSAVQAATALLKAIPVGWKKESEIKKRWAEFQQYHYPEVVCDPQDAMPKIHTGEITEFVKGEGKNYGRISPNVFFHVRQISDSTESGLLLRKLLASGLGKGLEVSYVWGESWSLANKVAATSIDLTPKGYQNALRLVESGAKIDEYQKGFVEFYDAHREQGMIRSGEKKYKFRLGGIADPYLKAYYQQAFSTREQDVSFELNGKTAYNICWENPLQSDWEAYAQTVTASMRESWEKFRQKRLEEESGLSLSEQDPFEKYPFIELKLWQPKATVRPPALSWEKHQHRTNTVKEPPKIALGEPVVPVRNLALEAKAYADRARKDMVDGQYDRAEEEFEKALQYGGFNFGLVSDYITLFMQQPDKIHRAVEILDRFANLFPSEKLLNIRIQVYDKMKDYQKLCPLYEEAVSTSASVSRRSHYLIRLIDAYIKIAKYDKALDACIRWEAFYNQNQYSSDADKMKRAAPGVERQKAICYYHTGKVEEARRIAINLIRSNPADEAANSILSGTLARTVEYGAATTDVLADDDDPFADDEMKGDETQMSRFIRTKIQQADISTNIRTSKLKDGKFSGTVEEAAEEIRRLLRSRRTFASPRARSDMLFAACKFLEQTEQQSDGEARGLNYKYRLAGRAMASWGDYMVSQGSQIDTPRMAYLSALKLLLPLKSRLEQDWHNSYNRYLRSFFVAKVGNESLEAYINDKQLSQERDAANTDIFTEKTIPEVLIPEFLVGMLKFVGALEKYPDHQRSLIDDLYRRSKVLRKSVCIQLSHFLGMNVPEDISKAEFYRLVLSAEEKLKSNIETLNANLVAVSSQLMLRKLSIELVDKLTPSNWSDTLTGTDANRLGRINYIIRRAQDYYESSDFDNRADCLRAAILALNDLQKVIRDEPTDISFDVFLPALDQMALKLTDTEMSLYQDYQPKLSWSESIQPFRTTDDKIQIQLMVENEVNYQSADSLQIDYVRGPEIIGFDKGTEIESLRGGEQREIILTVRINEVAQQNYSFTAVICYNYKCNESPENVITKNQEREFSFVIRREEAKRLINPFDHFVGNTMSDHTMFFGRDEQIRRIAENIQVDAEGNMNYGRAIAMYGQTRTGKSSLLFHLKAKITQMYGDRVLIWDMGSLGKKATEESGNFMPIFLHGMLSRCRESIWDNERIERRVREAGLEPPLKEILAQPQYATAYFEEYMSGLDRLVRREQMIIVLMIDEFTYLHEKIRSGEISTDFMRFWKALLQEYSIFAIIAGQDDTPEFKREYSNEFNCMELMKLNYLDEKSAKRLIREPLEKKNDCVGLFREDGCIDRLYELTAGSPYLTILLCSQLVHYLNDKGAYIVTGGIIDDFLRTKVLSPDSFLEDTHFEAQLQERGHRELDGVNKEILLSVARLSRTAGYARLEDIDCVGKTADEIRELVDRLEDRNVLVKEGGDHYWIQVKLLEQWLIQKNGA